MRSWSGPVVVGLALGFGFAVAVGSEEPETRSAADNGQDPAVNEQDTDAVSADSADEPGAVVTITFDDGPHGTYTPQILDILDRHDAVAVFCVVGRMVGDHPALIRRIAADGHALCNHTFTHDSDLSHRSDPHIEREVTSTSKAVHSAAPGVAIPYFRQPTMFVTDEVAAVTDALGYERLDWTIDTRDWTSPGADAIVDSVVQQLKPGAIILLHDGGGDRTDTVEALPRILDAIAAAGLQSGLPG